MRIRAVIFDLGHTLWDIGPDRGALARAYAAARATLCERLERDDLPEAAAMQRAVRDVLHEASESYFMLASRLDQPASSSWIDAGLRSLGITLEDDVLREITPALFATEIEELICGDDTVEAVRELHASGLQLGCVTNTLADTAAIRAMLAKHGMEEIMSSVVVSADEGWRKPHRSLFEKALRQLGVAPAEAVFVGDSPFHDIGGAKDAGMHAVLTTQYKMRPTEGFAVADATIAHVRELAAVIGELEKRVPAG